MDHAQHVVDQWRAERPDLDATPILVIGRIHRLAIALDVDGYILKPISIEKLTSTIDRVFSRKQTLKSAAHYDGIALPEATT